MRETLFGKWRADLLHGLPRAIANTVLCTLIGTFAIWLPAGLRSRRATT